MRIKTWHDVNTVEDSLEKIIYPLQMDDEYDRGKVNEYQSQINCFQGSLSAMNHNKEATLPHNPEFITIQKPHLPVSESWIRPLFGKWDGNGKIVVRYAQLASVKWNYWTIWLHIVD